MIGLSILLSLSLLATIFGIIEPVQSVNRLAGLHQRVTSGDVSTIRSWMTLPYIARVYHVLERSLDTWLHISDPQPIRHTSLLALADRLHRSVDGLIHEIQQAILTYRRQHQPQRFPTTTNANQHNVALLLVGRSLC